MTLLCFNIDAKLFVSAPTDPLRMILVSYLKRFIWGWFPIWVFRAWWKASFLSEGDTNKVVTKWHEQSSLSLWRHLHTARHLAAHVGKLYFGGVYYIANKKVWFKCVKKSWNTKMKEWAIIFVFSNRGRKKGDTNSTVIVIIMIFQPPLTYSSLFHRQFHPPLTNDEDDEI